MKIFDYHSITEANQYKFFQIPKDLVIDSYFSALSTDAKMLYGFMLDRMSLSKKNGWIDKNNRVYIIFTMKDCMETFNCGKDKSLKLFSELKKYNLIKQIKQGQGKPSLLYVCNIHKELPDDLEKGAISLSQSSENTEVKSSENTEVKSSENTEVKSSENTEVKTSENVEPNYTNINYTNNNYTNSYQSIDETDEELNKFLLALKKKIDIEVYLSVYPDDEECLFDIIDIMGSSLATFKIINFAGKKYQRREIMIFLYRITADYMHELVSKYKKIRVSAQINDKKKYMFTVILDMAFKIPSPSVELSLSQQQFNPPFLPKNSFTNYNQKIYTDAEIEEILARKKQRQKEERERSANDKISDSMQFL